MKRLSIALAISLLSATAAFAAPSDNPRCNPAMQNWVNGSHNTCSITDPNKEPVTHNSYERESTTSDLK